MGTPSCNIVKVLITSAGRSEYLPLSSISCRGCDDNGALLLADDEAAQQPDDAHAPPTGEAPARTAALANYCWRMACKCKNGGLLQQPLHAIRASPAGLLAALEALCGCDEDARLRALSAAVLAAFPSGTVRDLRVNAHAFDGGALCSTFLKEVEAAGADKRCDLLIHGAHLSIDSALLLIPRRLACPAEQCSSAWRGHIFVRIFHKPSFISHLS